MTILGMNILNLISRETGKFFYEFLRCLLKGKSGDCTGNLSPQGEILPTNEFQLFQGPSIKS